MKNINRGFTLVEIAIVLLIIGLLIGGLLRGQELITSARVRNMMDQKSSLQAAMISFMDRYKMQAGDLTLLQSAIVGMGALPSTVGSGDGIITIGSEGVLVFQNLAATGFISCGACMTVTGNGVHTIANSPINPFGDFMYTGRATSGTASQARWWWHYTSPGLTRNILGTGGSIPSQLMAELDRKADDGLPGTGSLRLAAIGSQGDVVNCAPLLAEFIDIVPTSVAQWANPTFNDCAASWLL